MALLLDRGENPSFAAGYDDADGDDDDGQCHLLSGVFAYSIQGLLGLVSISSLLVKRRLESPRRPVVVWLLDVSKQCVGGFFIHFSNIVVSEWLQASRRHFCLRLRRRRCLVVPSCSTPVQWPLPRHLEPSARASGDRRARVS